MTDASRSGPDWIKVIGECGLVVALAVAWLYLAGWRYAEQYFAAFGISISAIELKREYLITYGFWTFRRFMMPLLILGSMIFATVWVLRRNGRIFPPSVVIGITVGLIILLFSLAHWLGGSLAENRFRELRDTGFPGYRNVRVEMAPEWSKDSTELDRLAKALADPDACYRLIFSDTTSVFLFRPISSGATVPVETLHLARSDIKAMRVRDTERNCAL